MNFQRAPVQVDEATVRAFVETFHKHTAHALAGASQPGLLQLVRLHPADETMTVAGRFAIGDVDRMAQAAIQDAEAGFNVYIEGRTVSNSAKGRGKAADTRAVVALAIDSDADKGKAGRAEVEPTLVVETSPGNRHLWLFLDRALTA